MIFSDKNIRKQSVESMNDIKGLAADEIMTVCKELKMPKLHQQKFIKACHKYQTSNNNNKNGMFCLKIK